MLNFKQSASSSPVSVKNAVPQPTELESLGMCLR